MQLCKNYPPQQLLIIGPLGQIVEQNIIFFRFPND